MTIYDRIRTLRVASGMSQEELGKKCGYEGRSMISRVEAGKIDLPLSKLELFANALNVTPEYLFGVAEDQNRLDRISIYLELFNKIRMLDDIDRVRIAERVDTMLESPKYQED